MTAPDVRFRSDREMVLAKPPGRSCELPGDARGDSWIAEVEQALGVAPLRLSHRLDRPASGLLLVALDREASASHAAQFRGQRVAKAYLARVRGKDPTALVGRHRAYLRPSGRITTIVRSGGDPSSLEVVAAAPSPSRRGEHHVLIRLETGRRHQIRAMLAHLGAPLVGDADYGGDAGPFWLESVLLGFDSVGRQRRVVLATPAGLLGEPADPSLIDALGRLASMARHEEPPSSSTQ